MDSKAAKNLEVYIWCELKELLELCTAGLRNRKGTPTGQGWWKVSPISSYRQYHGGGSYSSTMTATAAGQALKIMREENRYLTTGIVITQV